MQSSAQSALDSLGTSKLMIIVPALNEELAIAGVVRSIQDVLPGIPILVIDDYSEDATVTVATRVGARVLRLPVHLGLGGCVQAGYKMAFEDGFDYVIRVDGDGQHEAGDIPKVLQALLETGAEVVIGSRFIGNHLEHKSMARLVGISFFRILLKAVLGKPIHDPTSGFVGVNRRALQVFSRTFPLSYPEIEVLVILQRKRFRFHEISCRMGPRLTGKSSFTPLKSFRYMLHVLLGVFVNVLRFDAIAKKSEFDA